MWGFFAGYAKLIISLLQDVQENDQRLTMLQLVDKIKTKHKEVGGSVTLVNLLSNARGKQMPILNIIVH